MSSDIQTVVEDFYAAIERNDFDAVGALYADDLKLWRSFDLVVQDKHDQMETLSALNARWTSKYRLIERHFIGDKVVQRHELIISEADGTVAHRLQAAAFLTIRDGQVHELDEYLDSRDVAAIEKGLRKSAA